MTPQPIFRGQEAAHGFVHVLVVHAVARYRWSDGIFRRPDKR